MKDELGGQIMSKNRRYLQRYCIRCWNKIWHLKFWIWQTIVPKIKNKNVIGLMKDELGGHIMKEKIVF